MSNNVYIIIYIESYCDYGVYGVYVDRKTLDETLENMFGISFRDLSIDRINEVYGAMGKTPLDFYCDKAETFKDCSFRIEEHPLIGGKL